MKSGNRPISFFLGAALALLSAQLAAPQQPAADDADKGGRVEGRVFSQLDGTPLGGATVRLRKEEAAGFAAVPDPNEGAYSSQAGIDGRYIFTGVEPGRYRIYADRPGYLRRFYGARANTEMSPGTVVEVSAGQTMKNLDMEMSRLGAITGLVRDQAGEPVTEAQVSAMRVWYEDGVRELLPLGSVKTDVNGNFALRSLLPGKYYVCVEQKLPSRIAGASRNGQRQAVENMLGRTCYPDAGSPRDAIAVDVRSASSVDSMELRMRPIKLFRIGGQVEWEGEARPERPLLLELIPKSRDVFVAPGHRMARVQNDGAFLFEEVAEGSYSIEPARAMVDSSGNRRLGGRADVVVRRDDVPDVKLRVLRTPDITGRIRIEGASAGQTGAAPPASSVNVEPVPAYEENKAAGGPASVKTASQRVPPPPGYAPESPAKPGDKIANVLLTPRPAPPDEKSPVAAASAGVVSGHVDSRSLAGMSVRLSAAEHLSMNAPTTVTDRDGGFVLPSVQLDRYRLQTSNLPEGTYVKTVLFNGQDITNWVVDLSGSFGGQLDVLLSNDAGEVSGEVRDAKGNAVPASWVSVWRTDSGLAGIARPADVVITDGRGAFRVGNLPPGQYRAVAWEEVEYGLAQAPDFCRRFEGSDSAVLKLGQRGRETVTLRPIASSRVEEVRWQLP
ncbi:MAG TPA: carboxypeptidase regulatory-like domain-containing protein [Bryobacteraceae bacterium]